MMKKRGWICLLLSGLMLLIPSITVRAADKLLVIASFSILTDLTQQIGGDRLRVHTLVESGNDAHVHQPTPADARILSQARLVIVNGLGFEGWIDRLIKASAYQGKIVIASQGITPLYLAPAGRSSSPHEHHAPTGSIDPHAWQDLNNARIYVTNITNALSEIDPGNKFFSRPTLHVCVSK